MIGRPTNREIAHFKKILLLLTKENILKVTKSDKDLLLLIQKDDKVAFYNIYERYSRRLYGFVIRYIKLEADAEEIVQEVFVKIWESRNKIDVYSSFEFFLFTIAYNTTMSLLRKRSSEKKYLDHLKAIQEIQQLMMDPEAMQKWFQQKKEEFEALPED